jgi:hypothetical protein
MCGNTVLIASAVASVIPHSRPSGSRDDARTVVPRIATAFESRCRMCLPVARGMSIFRSDDAADLTAKCVKWFLRKASDGPARGNRQE